MIPIGFNVMQTFLRAGFKLKEIVIKEQHNCSSTGYWRNQSIKYNFLLIAHEYLFISGNEFFCFAGCFPLMPK